MTHGRARTLHVLLDACVLYPQAVTDALMSLATSGLYAAKWTRRIETEWIQAVERDRPDLRGRLESRRDAMRDAVPDWEVEERAWQPLEVGLHLPDVNDRHVLAAAPRDMPTASSLRTSRTFRAARRRRWASK